MRQRALEALSARFLSDSDRVEWVAHSGEAEALDAAPSSYCLRQQVPDVSVQRGRTNSGMGG